MSLKTAYHLIFGEALDALNRMKDNSIDCIITDPPYASLEDHRKIGTTTRLKGKWFETIPDEAWGEYLREFYRVLKPGMHVYIMVNKDAAYVFQPAAVKAGFTYWNTLVWRTGRTSTGYHYRSEKQFILFFEKRIGKHKRALRDNTSITDVIDKSLPTDFIEGIKLKYAKHRLHPAEKPPELMEIFVEQSTKPKEVILDPFMGVGTTGVAALRKNRSFIGVETDKEYFGIAENLLLETRNANHKRT